MGLALIAASGDRVEPVGAAEFARLMERFAPFEPAPHVAVALSGGSDSLALAILARDWARSCGGRATALTVDHGLRPESAAEARHVASQCAALGIGHRVLTWLGPKPRSGIQEAARAARYRLLEAWCASHHVLHLLLAHQREDQAETTLMRLLHGSGIVGLAGMAPVAERGKLRLLRPVLSVSRARLRATLAAAGQDWIDDPSNLNPVFLRVRLRAAMASFTEHGLTVERLAGLAEQAASLRAALEGEVAHLLTRMVTFDPGGFAWLDRDALRQASDAVGIEALAAVLVTVSGAEYAPRRERLDRLYRLLPDGLAGGRTLGGCLIMPRRGKILVCREPAAAAPPVELVPGAAMRWDGRFSAELGPGEEAGLCLGPLGRDAGSVGAASPFDLGAVPAAARPTLACLRDRKGVVAVPALRYFSPRWTQGRAAAFRLIFRPTRPLTGAGFTIV